MDALVGSVRKAMGVDIRILPKALAKDVELRLRVVDGSDPTCDYISPREYVPINKGVIVNNDPVSDTSYIKAEGVYKACRIGSFSTIGAEVAVWVPCTVSEDDRFAVELVKKSPRSSTESNEGESN